MIALVLLLVLLLTTVAATVSTVARDGYGHRSAPRSHPADAFGPR